MLAGYRQSAAAPVAHQIISSRTPSPCSRGQKKFQPPSIGWFIEQWLQSDFFAPPDKPRPKDKPFRPGTQYNYRLGIELLRQIKGGDGTSMAELPLDRLTPRMANLYIQKIKRERSGSTALTQKNILSNLWKFAGRFVEFNPGDRPNPMAGREIEQPYKVRQEHKPWPQDVQDRFLPPVMPIYISPSIYCFAPASGFPMWRR